MARIPGTGGPTEVPYKPEGGEQDGPLSSTVTGPLPGGSNRYPQPAPAGVTAQQGAGSGAGGLYPGAEGSSRAGDGQILKGYKGSSYAAGGPDDFQPPDGDGRGGVWETGGANGASVGALSVPTSFTKASTNQG